MYCPRCAAQNLDDAKFCRGCGFGLESVALAVAGKLKRADSDEEEEPRTWLEKRRKGVNKLVRASGLLSSSLIIGAALGLFSNENDWIIIWMVFGGWMAVWGMFSLVSGIQYLLDSRYMRADAGVRETGELKTPIPFQQLPEHNFASTVSSQPSVTEHTTRALVEPIKKSTNHAE